MDNIPRSLPKRSFTSYSNVAFTSHKSAYDGVFGASPKFRLLTLAPRLEEFSEIFGGFHASRSFSLPILDLSLIGDDSNLLHFDRDFDYTEVFGDSRCVGFASSEDLVGQSSGRYDSSDEPWSPAQSGSLSDEFDALAGSDKSKNIGTVLTETSHVTKFSSLPGYTFSHYGSPVSLDGEDENCSVSVVSDLNSCKEYGKRVTEEKQYTKYSANSVHSGLNSPRSDFNLLEKHGNSTSKPFMIVSDISLRTKPSRLPPPSRPPPALVVKKLDSDRSGLKLKASKSYDFERVSDDSASLSFDVEVDSTLSPEDRENGNKNVKSKHESTKESIERKDMQVEEKRNKTARVSNSIMEEMPESHGKETTTSLPVIEDTIESSRGIEDISGSEEVRYCNLHGVDNSAGPVAWREATEYYEVIEKNASQEAFDTTMLHMDRDAYRHRSTTGYDTFDGQEDWKKLKVSKEAQGLEEERMQQFGESKRLQADHTETAEVRAEAKGNLSEVDAKSKPKAFPKGVDVDFSKRFIDAQIIKQSIVEHKQSILTEECSRKLEDMEGAETKERVKLRTEPEGIKKQHTGAFVKEKDPNENEMTSKEVKEHGESDKKSYIAAGLEKTGDGQLACEVEKDRERLMEAGKHIKNELTYRDAPQQVSGEKEDKLHHTKEVTKERSGNTSKTEESGLRFRRADIDAGNMVEIFKINRHMNLSRAGGVQENLSGHAEEIEPIERNQSEKEVERDVDTYFLIEEDQLEEFNAGCKLDEAVATKVSGKHDNEGVDSTLVKGKSNGFSKNGNELQDGITHGAANNNVESSCLPKQMTDSNIRGSGMGTSFVRTDSDRIFSALACSHESEKIMSSEDDQRPQIKGTQFIRKMVDIGDTFTPCQVIRESTVNGRKVEDASSVLKHSDDTLYSIKNVASQRIERKGYNMKENLTAKEQKVGDRIRREIELENEHIRKIEEEKERERERVKDRMAVDKGAIEARERSYAATRERTERAALERATAEVRQRAMAGARERLEKASMETKLRAERAAVERATAEARQRAAEKLVAQKPAFEANDRVERSVPDKFSAHFPSADTRQNSSSFDIHLQSAGISNSLRYSYSSAHVGGESPQRCKARLERYRRTADRAATALAEKNNRDLLAQREREEMNRVAESLHAEVKRWSSGKEGNLRSLLSTLQYILGPDSSWQPVPLTEIITSAAVKKAYRKATLCVHPDKLQQRGASVQQKYICEKVFDLLKEAWNKFNSEER